VRQLEEPVKTKQYRGTYVINETRKKLDVTQKSNTDKLKKSWATSQSMLQGAAANKVSIDHFFELLSKQSWSFQLLLSFCWPWTRVTPLSTNLQGDSRSLELPTSEHRHLSRMKTGNQSP
jgi:hypothetical protein